MGELAPLERNTLIDLLPMTHTTLHSIKNRDLLREEIEESVKNGVFIAREEGGERVIAFGIAGEISGRVTALSIVGAASRMEKCLDEYVALLVEARGEFFRTRLRSP